ncbi:MAG: hypothetical protein RIS21_1227, partial [Planctomycetota bacterium]
ASENFEEFAFLRAERVLQSRIEAGRRSLARRPKEP